MAPAEPPLVSHLLFEAPMALVITLAVVGVALLLHGRRRLNKRIMGVALIPLALAAGVWLTAKIVETPREQLLARNARLVELTAPLDTAQLKAMFAPDAALTGPNGGQWMTFSRIFAVIENFNRRSAIQNQEITGIAAEAVDGGKGVTEFEVRTGVAGEYSGMPITTRWLLTWERNGRGEWVVNEVRWLKLQNAEPSMGAWR